MLREHLGRRHLHLKISSKSSKPWFSTLAVLQSHFGMCCKVMLRLRCVPQDSGIGLGYDLAIRIFKLPGDCSMLPRLRTIDLKFTLSFLICKIGKKGKKKYPCFLPSLPHKDIEGKGENNGRVLTLWVKTGIGR